MRATWPLALLLCGVAVTTGCGRESSAVPVDAAAQAGGQNGGLPGIGTILGLLPDGGLSVLLGDGGMADLVCEPQVRLGAPCSADAPACVLSSLAGVCACVAGQYLCPANSSSGPKPCPASVATGTPCLSPMAICIASSTACLCGVGTYVCL